MFEVFKYSNEPLVNLLKQYLASFSMKVSDNELREHLLCHPDYPSLLSVSDTLSKFGIENAGFRTAANDLEQLPEPFIGYLSGEFKIVKKVTPEKVVVIENSGRETIDTREIFNRKWSEIALFGEPSVHHRKESVKSYKIDRNIILISTSIITYILLLFVSCISFYQENTVMSSVLYLMHLLLKSIGIAISALLVWYEIDKYNLSLKKFCSGIGKNVNCNAVLNSKYSKAFGDISWSEISVVYFMACFFLLLFNWETLPIIQLFILMSAPYIIFSLYFQAYVIKEWCPFCITIQFVFLFEILLTITYLANSYISFDEYVQSISNLSFLQYIRIGVIFSLTGIIFYILKSVFSFNISNKNIRFDYARLKRNREVFNSILIAQKKLDENWKYIGIRLGSDHAKNTLLKVCNPYCYPCSKAHHDLNDLINNNDDINVKIIYNASSEDYDITKYPVRHFLALAENGDADVLRKALDDWYFDDTKDYNIFSSKFQNVKDLAKHDYKINEMHKWVNLNQITYTPTYFFNGRQLPVDYNISDLKYIRDL